MAPMQRPPTIAEVMAQLRQEFPGNVLDDDFTRIQEIIASETYLDFLKRTHPLENPFQTFNEFLDECRRGYRGIPGIFERIF